MNNILVYITFVIYLIIMIGIGTYFYTRAKKLEDYLLGGKGMGSWVTALSAQASDMSGWLLMGLPGAVYLLGLNQTWIALGLIVGTYLNWKFISARLRLYTGSTDALTLSTFFDRRFKDPTKLLRIFSSIFILIFFTVYAAAGLVSAGKLFESMFGISYIVAVIVGTAIMIFYTLLGGFLAVCWTDLFQASLMVFAIIILPIIAYSNIEPGAIEAVLQARPELLSFMPEGTFIVAITAIISTAAWGLGYFGQPHILVRFMSVKEIKMLPFSRRIAMVWVVISLVCSVIIGLLGIPLYEGLSSGDAEKVLIFMVRDFVTPAFAGVLLAAILAAIMSTIDSQFLVASSTLTEDIYASMIRKEASSNELLLVSRLCVVLIAILSLVMAMDTSSSIFGLVTFAWGGFGSVFGPVVIMSLYSRKTTWYSALAGMVIGGAVMLVWYATGLGKVMYEIVPGFLVNFIVIFVINHFKPNEDAEINTQFDEMVSNLNAGITPK